MGTREFDGRVAIVSGGASGIGRVIVERLAENGARTVIADIDQGARRGHGPRASRARSPGPLRADRRPR